MNEQIMLERLLDHFGIEKLLRALPQREVVEAFGWRSVSDLATEVSMTEGGFRRLMDSGDVPSPTHRLHRRMYYTSEEAEKIRTHLGTHAAK